MDSQEGAGEWPGRGNSHSGTGRCFGAHSRIHTAKILRLSEDLPIIIEIVDILEKIEKFIPQIESAITEGLATLEKVEIRFYRSGKK